MITLITAAVLCAVAKTASPERWQKYISIITGIMLVSVIVTPVFEIAKIDLFSGYDYSEDIDLTAQHKAVCTELEKQVAADAEKRLSESLRGEYKVQVKLSVNQNNEIEGVKEMIVWTKEKKEPIKSLLWKVYSPEKISFPN